MGTLLQTNSIFYFLHQLSSLLQDKNLSMTQAIKTIVARLSEQTSTMVKAAKNPENFIKIAADSVETLRKVDVDRVLTETPTQFRSGVAEYIKSKRKDLVQEVDDVMGEL